MSNQELKGLNGNIEALEFVAKVLGDLQQGWDVLSDQAKKDLISDVRHKIANVRTNIEGWRDLDKARRSVKGEDQ
jgi:hypothetical protein